VYKYVVVWCADISMVIGSAELLAPNVAPTPPAPTPPAPTPPAPTPPAPTPPAPTPPAPTPKVIFRGTLSGDSRGSVEIEQTGTARVLKLSSDFKANGTNNVNLWIAKDAKGKDYIGFSNFKTLGAQTFNIPASLDLSVYKYIIVWCADVRVVIGTAELMATN
jgi:hypothetical protein